YTSHLHSHLFSLLSFPAPATPATYPLSLHDALPISTITALRCYAEHRERFCPIPRASTFFLSDAGIPVKYRRVNDAIVRLRRRLDRKSTRLNSSHEWISYAVFCLKKKNNIQTICHHV